MLRHHFLIVFRNFKRHKSSFFINLLGLSSGLACALLIYLWVNDELSMDKFHEKDSRIFLVMAHHQEAEGITTMTWTPGLLAEALAEEMPEVEYAVSASEIIDEFTLSINDQHIRATGQFVGKNYFNIFSYDLIQGDKNQVSVDKNAIVISESLAMKLFNTTENVIGRTVEWQAHIFEKQVVVAGVFKDVPPQSSDQFDFVLSFDCFQDDLIENVNWDNYYALTHVALQEGTNIAQFNQKIADFVKTKNENSNITLFLKPLSDKYLYGNYENGIQTGGRIEYVRLFSIIAIFILIVACINFMNLSTAKASRRIKEVGMKKAVGAGRNTLIVQYLAEPLLMTFLSLLMGIVFVLLFLPQFNLITGKQLVLNFDADMVLSLLGITFCTGLIAGSYPALYLSGFSPAIVLKGKLNSSTGELWARKGLVVFQFSLSVILIVSVIVVYQQIELVQNKNLGYERDNIIHFRSEGRVTKSLEPFLAELKKIPGIVDAASMRENVVGMNSFTTGLSWEGKNPDDIIRFQSMTVNYGLIETLDMEVVAGRSFSSDFISDTAAIIFNEAAVRVMGLKDPVGKVVNLWGQDRQIVGVVKDFHFASLREQVAPLFIKLGLSDALLIMAKIEAGRERETIEQLQEFYQAYNPGYTLDYRFLDEDYQAQYVAEQRVSVLSLYFAGLAILISCLGLFGLAAFTAERRTKEIGIRKVLGSSEMGIVKILSGDFTKMVLIAIAIALPVSFLVTDRWLESFAYHIDLEWWYFAGAGVVTLVIAWLTVGMQTVRAAMVNPVECLKAE